MFVSTLVALQTSDILFTIATESAINATSASKFWGFINVGTFEIAITLCQRKYILRMFLNSEPLLNILIHNKGCLCTGMQIVGMIYIVDTPFGL